MLFKILHQRIFNKISQSGFTLLEVIIALTVFSIGILAMNTMQITSIGGNATAYKVTGMTTWASDRIEQIMALDYNNTALDDDNGLGPGIINNGLDNQTAATADGNITSPDGLYNIFWNVYADPALPNMKKIRIIVTTNDAGTQRSVTFDYLKVNAI